MRWGGVASSWDHGIECVWGGVVDGVGGLRKWLWRRRGVETGEMAGGLDFLL